MYHDIYNKRERERERERTYLSTLQGNKNKLNCKIRTCILLFLSVYVKINWLLE
jgi:hypothetical protein